MANTVREQVAVCEKVATFKTSKGDKEVYTLRAAQIGCANKSQIRHKNNGGSL